MIIRYIYFLVVCLMVCLAFVFINSVIEGSKDQKHLGQNIKGETLPDKTLSLTFDDGPSDEATLDIGKYLYEQDIEATFFVVGEDSLGRESILKQLSEWGHLIANHSWSHCSMITITPDQAIEEVSRTDRLIRTYMEDGISLFRAPYGAFNQKVGKILTKAGLDNYVGSIHWDIGGCQKKGYAADWACWEQGISVVDCAEGYFKESEDRGKGIVLFHDFDVKTTQMLRILVPMWKAADYNFTRIDNVPKIREKLNMPLLNSKDEVIAMATNNEE